MDIVGYINSQLDWATAKKQAMLDDFVAQYGYEEEDEDGNPNPVTKKAFMNSKIIEYIKGTVNARRRRVAEEAIEYELLNGDLV